MEIRQQAIASAAMLAAGALLLRLFPPAIYAFYPSCPFRSLTGWQCPGCGATRALAALLDGRFADAARYNAPATVLALAGPVIGALQVYSALRWNRWRPIPLGPRAAALASGALALFAMLRNFA